MLDIKVPTGLGVLGVSACLLPSGMILISGGRHDSDTHALNTVFGFNAETSSLAPLPPMTYSRCNHAIVLSRNLRHVYVIGGQNSDSALAMVERYDVFDNSWSPIASMKQPRSSLTSCSILL